MYIVKNIFGNKKVKIFFAKKLQNVIKKSNEPIK